MRKILKRVAIVGSGLLLLVVGVGGLGASYLDWSDTSNLSKTQIADLHYLAQSQPLVRGKVLAVVTSTATMQVPSKNGVKEKPAGFELTELARAYAVLTANGFAVDVASPLGGAAPFVRDDDDMGAYDYAFLNDATAMSKVAQSKKLSEVVVSDYAAIYLVGGKGTMFDFRGNSSLQDLVAKAWEQGAIVSAVCHGPAGLLGVRLSDGQDLLKNRRVTGFTNAEELFLIKRAPEVFGRLLEDDLVRAGAQFVAGPQYLGQLVIDGKLITGQNPWSVWALAEAVVRQLGQTPVPREVTGEELAVRVLTAYRLHGRDAAYHALNALPLAEKARLDRNLIGMHILVSLMQKQWRQSRDLFLLLRQAKIKAAAMG